MTAPADPAPAADDGPAPPPDRRPRRGDLAVAVGTLLYLVSAALPWVRTEGFDLGSGYRAPAASANGYDSVLVVAAAVLLVLASGWALRAPVPALPRAAVPAGVAALALLLTVIAWLAATGAQVPWTGLLAVLAAVAVLGAAALRLLPELTGDAVLPGRLAAAVRWAGRPLSRRPEDRGEDPPG